MSSDLREANCKTCGRSFEYGLFSRNYPYCYECAAELDEESLRRIGEGEVRWIEDSVPSTPRRESEVERQQRYTEEDHRRGNG
jgi:hypothetical protein